MATIITRVYKDEKAAKAVAATLQQGGFAARDVSVVGGGEGIADRLTGAGVGANTAAAAAEKIEGGNAAVVIAAPFGKAVKAQRIVDAAKPIALSVDKADDYVPAGEMAASKPDKVMGSHPRFLTSSNYPGGARDSKPFSALFGMRMLSDRRAPNAVIRGGRLFLSTHPISHIRFGANLTGRHGTPLSRLLSWPTVTRGRLNSPINQDNPTPLSNLLGWRTIIRR